jgi:hypothetical protein
MRDFAIVCNRALLAVALCTAAAACTERQSGDVASVHSEQRARHASVDRLDDPTLLRTRIDRLRNRIWHLKNDAVAVHDLVDGRLVHTIALLTWSVASGVCLPDLVLDESGSAIVASNAHPTLWRIDGSSFEVREYEIRLLGKEGWAIGFGALGFDSDRNLRAMVATGNSLWRIDLAQERAEMLAFYDVPVEDCRSTDLSEPLPRSATAE